uniref:PIN domain-containing protein n=1 Tax=Candidatus Kentrum sp. FM TaxID=2126340 RepID=A0A450SEY6_9GAMM|nr:MAG: PIN domain-containing protein [Candidatus Kentron sp. FM]VFJ51316.1 MAG: PIN domain-containing protein [Candidatus Kentron sp. FM]VFK08884.1 MAG: PIN domain-containing protein [Candidatus Kentron sp. FM]
MATKPNDNIMDAAHNTVYIETSIPSFYYTLRADPASVARMRWTRQWWREYAGKSTFITSAAVIEELRQGTAGKNEERISLLDGAMILPISDEVIEIARIYIDKLVMPRDPKGDALHLAFASYHKADFLLTWNCRHLANANKFHHIRVVNFELGLPCPVLTTPLNFLSGGDDDE